MKQFMNSQRSKSAEIQKIWKLLDPKGRRSHSSGASGGLIRNWIHHSRQDSNSHDRCIEYVWSRSIQTHVRQSNVAKAFKSCTHRRCFATQNDEENAYSQIALDDEGIQPRLPSQSPNVSHISHQYRASRGDFSFELIKSDWCPQALATVIAKSNRTEVLVVVTKDSKGPQVRDSPPLTVVYRERASARGFIPGSYTRKEGRLSDHEILVSRCIDRSIRPLFPSTGMEAEIQVSCTLLSADSYSDPVPLAINAASAALSLSNIPWLGPVGSVRMVKDSHGGWRLSGDLMDAAESEGSLLVSAKEKGVTMIDFEGIGKVDAKSLRAGIISAHLRIRSDCLAKINLLISESEQGTWLSRPPYSNGARDGMQRLTNRLGMYSAMAERLLSESRKNAILQATGKKKIDRGDIFNANQKELLEMMAMEFPDGQVEEFEYTIDELTKRLYSESVVHRGIRIDSRHADEIRQIRCKVNVLGGNVHGSAIFSRGETSVLSTVSIALLERAMRTEQHHGATQGSKRFMLHYEFPPFSTGETGGSNPSEGRREIGHGSLAEKALRSMLPSKHIDLDTCSAPNYQKLFPYAIRANALVTSSDGSSSMATICASSMALMDAGVPLPEHVAGVSVGCLQYTAENQLPKHLVVVDILGFEDHCSIMDFKIAGTMDRVTALQMDVSTTEGVSDEILTEAIEKGSKGLRSILARMRAQIDTPRYPPRENVPRTTMVDLDPLFVSLFASQQGANLKRIERYSDSALRLIDDVHGRTRLLIESPNLHCYDKAYEKVFELIGEIKAGDRYMGKVKVLLQSGALVEILEGRLGFLHISQRTKSADRTSTTPINSATGKPFEVGEEVFVEVLQYDKLRGNIKLGVASAELGRPSAATVHKSRLTQLFEEEAGSQAQFLIGKPAAPSMTRKFREPETTDSKMHHVDDRRFELRRDSSVSKGKADAGSGIHISEEPQTRMHGPGHLHGPRHHVPHTGIASEHEYVRALGSITEEQHETKSETEYTNPSENRENPANFPSKLATNSENIGSAGYHDNESSSSQHHTNVEPTTTLMRPNTSSTNQSLSMEATSLAAGRSVPAPVHSETQAIYGGEGVDDKSRLLRDFDPVTPLTNSADMKGDHGVGVARRSSNSTSSSNSDGTTSSIAESSSTGKASPSVKKPRARSREKSKAKTKNSAKAKSSSKDKAKKPAKGKGKAKQEASAQRDDPYTSVDAAARTTHETKHVSREFGATSTDSE